MMLPFTPTGYSQLLNALRANHYRSITCDQLAAARDSGEKAVLIRHDVDMSLDYAHAMGQLEIEHCITSTYFVMLRSPLYNLWSRHNARRLREIVAMGHAIGLHFDAAFTQGSERTIEEWIRFEVATLASLADAPVVAFSLHQPTQVVLDQKIQLPGLINTYHPQHLAGFTYLSDSNRDWRGKDPLSLIKGGEPNIQLLVHPLWWMNQNPTTQGCWDDVITLNFQRMQEQLLATERAYGEARTFSLKPATS
ncbi:MAG: hypothetical protein ACOYNL_06805 [Rickettsiales bacterium]